MPLIELLTLLALIGAGASSIAFLVAYAVKYRHVWRVRDPFWRYVVVLNLAVGSIALFTFLGELGVPGARWARLGSLAVFAGAMFYQIALLWEDEA